MNMEKVEAAKALVELYSEYERLALGMHYSIRQKYSEAVAVAILSLREKEKDDFMKV